MDDSDYDAACAVFTAFGMTPNLARGLLDMVSGTMERVAHALQMALMSEGALREHKLESILPGLDASAITAICHAYDKHQAAFAVAQAQAAALAPPPAVPKAKAKAKPHASSSRSAAAVPDPRRHERLAAARASKAKAKERHEQYIKVVEMDEDLGPLAPILRNTKSQGALGKRRKAIKRVQAAAGKREKARKRRRLSPTSSAQDGEEAGEEEEDDVQEEEDDVPEEEEPEDMEELPQAHSVTEIIYSAANT